MSCPRWWRRSPRRAGGRRPRRSPPSGARVERLILHGSQRRWLDYLHGVIELIERAGTGAPSDPALARARARAIANHHNLLLGLPGPGARLTATDRARLRALADDPPGGA